MGWTQCWGESKEEMRPGDVIWCAPGKKHWHGDHRDVALSQSSKSWTARRSIGWKRSAMNNTSPD
jgi:quercetin dioxygenase-like cupin family protein